MVGEIGIFDRVLRVLLVPVAVIAATVFAPNNPWWAAVALLFSALMIATALIGKCPLYMLLGIHTTRRHEPEVPRSLPRAA